LVLAAGQGGGEKTRIALGAPHREQARAAPDTTPDASRIAAPGAPVEVRPLEVRAPDEPADRPPPQRLPPGRLDLDGDDIDPEELGALRNGQRVVLGPVGTDDVVTERGMIVSGDADLLADEDLDLLDDLDLDDGCTPDDQPVNGGGPGVGASREAGR